MDVNIRLLLLERIQDLNILLRKTSSQQSIDLLQDMLSLNKRIYFYIFNSEA